METATITAARTVALARLLNAPVALLFEVCSHVWHLVFWWEPKEFIHPYCEEHTIGRGECLGRAVAYATSMAMNQSQNPRS